MNKNSIYDFRLENLAKRNRLKRLMRRGIALLSAVVLLFTMNTLKFKADTLERIPACGQEEHVHTPDCYAGDGALVCGLQEHQHTDACFQQRPLPADETECVDADVADLDEIMLGAPDAAQEETEKETEVENKVENEETAEDIQVPDTHKYSYSMADRESVKLSEVLQAEDIPVQMNQIAMIGLVDGEDGVPAAEQLAIEPEAADFTFIPRQDFDRVEVAIVTDSDIITFELTDAAMPAPVEETEAPVEETEAPAEPAEAPAEAVEAPVGPVEEQTEAEEEQTEVEIEDAEETSEQEAAGVEAEANEPESDETAEDTADEPGEDNSIEEDSEPEAEPGEEEISEPEAESGEEAETEDEPVDAVEAVEGEDEEAVEADEEEAVEGEDEAEVETGEIEDTEEAGETEAAEETEAAGEIAAVIDMAGVGEFPLSLRALLAAIPVEPAVAVDAVDAEEAEDAVEAEAPAEPVELPAAEWTVGFDEELIAVEAAEDDYLITPVAAFDETRITVDNGRRYALTLVGFAPAEAEEAEAEAVEPAPACPAQKFEGRAAGVSVTVTAGEGAFPEGTTMVVRPVEDAATLNGIADTVQEDFVDVKRVHAVDIAFYNADGEEIEPLVPISVVMAVDELEENEEAVVVHVDDEGAAEVVDASDAPAVDALALDVEMPAGEAPAIEAVPAEAEAPAEDPVDMDGQVETVVFEADAFSVYAVVVTETIETRYIAADGATYNISVGFGPESGIPANAELDVRELTGAASEVCLNETAEALRGFEDITLARFFDITILADGQPIQPAAPVEVRVTLADGTDDAVKAVHFDHTGGMQMLDADRRDEAVAFSADSFSVYGVVYTVDFHYTVNGESFDYGIPGGDGVSLKALVAALGIAADDPETAADELAEFVESIDSAVFSNPELVSVSKVTEDTTVGGIKAALGLESVYSDQLTDEDIAAIDAREMKAVDWALISLQPFDTEETLTVTMANGDVFTILVTDAQISTRVLTADGESFIITLSFGPEAGIPADAVLQAEEIPQNSDEWFACAMRAMQDMDDSMLNDAAANRFFDIEILVDGEKIEPAAPVQVTIAYDDPMDLAAESELSVVHFSDSGTEIIRDLSVSEDGTQVSYTQAGFSVTGTIVTTPTSAGTTSQYMVLVKYDDEYYIVLNDGRLEKHDPSGQNKFITPMTWTWDGSHLYHNSLETGFTNDDRASDFYRRYINPRETDGLTQETSEQGQLGTVPIVQDGHGYDVIGSHNNALNNTVITYSDHKIVSSGQYIGVTLKDGKPSAISGGVTDSTQAAEIYLAQAVDVTREAYARLQIVDNPVANEKYIVLVEDGSHNYHVVALDGRTKALADTSQLIVYRKDIQEWTYNNGENLVDFAHLINIDPTNGQGVSSAQAHIVYDSANHRIKNYSSEQYIGLYWDWGAGCLHINGQWNGNNAATVYLAQVIDGAAYMDFAYPGQYAEASHVVNHIDIGIVGTANLTVPLAYGTYQYMGDDGHLKSVTFLEDTNLDLTQEVDIKKADIKKATIKAYTKELDTETNTIKDVYHDDLFTVTGYSGNRETPNSHDQVRIEGIFKVANLDPVSLDDRNTEETRRQRLANKVYYTVSTTKEVTFYFKHSVYGQLYDADGNKMKVTVNVNMSASFNYWDYYGYKVQGSNECPPLQENWSPDQSTFHYWHGYSDGNGGWINSGGIAADGNSGMDFVLGGDAGANANIVALNITKMVVDSQGDPIKLDETITNRFEIFYKNSLDDQGISTTENCNSVLNLHRNAYDAGAAAQEANSYNGFLSTSLHDKTIDVGEDGMGLIYDYDVSPGMFYITEDKSEEYLPRTIVDKEKRKWNYVGTYFKTEYIWRVHGDPKSDRHVSRMYTLEDGVYRSIPEVLGEYRDPNGATTGSDGYQLRNGFLKFFVYNVYEPEKVKIEVDKKWMRDGQEVAGPTGSSEKIRVTLGRFKLSDIPNYDPEGSLTIKDSFTGIPAEDYDATYTVTGPNFSQTYTFQNDLKNQPGYALTIDDRWGGHYTVTKTVSSVSGYTMQSNVTETLYPEVPVGGNAVAEFATTAFQQSQSGGTIVRVGVMVGNSIQDNNPDPYNARFTIRDCAAGSQLTFSYDSFYCEQWRRVVDAKWMLYQQVQEDIPRWRPVDNVQHDRPTSENPATINVGDKPLCILILHDDPGDISLMDIRLAPSGRSASGANAVYSMAPRGTAALQGTGSASTSVIGLYDTPPASPVEGKRYEPDAWTTTVELNNAGNWAATLMDPSDPTKEWALDEYDADGNEYIYYVVNVDETGLTTKPLQLNINQTYVKTIDADGNIRFTFAMTNDMPPNTTRIKIKKVGKNGELLSGAHFRVNRDGELFLADLAVTNGYSAEFEVTPGHYTLIETAFPDGYVRTGGNPEFDISVNPSTLAVEVTYESTKVTNGEITVVNEPGSRLPSTGGPGTAAYTVGGAALMLLAIALLLLRKREI